MTLSKYKFEEIAINCTQKRFPTEEDQPLYIGLEHLDTGNLHVDRWGSPVPLKGEKLIMRKGDVLLGRRNAYLRRAAVAPHDGLFSAHGMVLQPREDVIDKEFFPLFIASDYFFDEANRISVGSLSPTINWKDLRSVEFEIPSMEKQRELAKVLWAMDTTKRSYQKLLQKTDELAKALFIEMFGDPITNPMEWETKPLSDVAPEVQYNGVFGDIVWLLNLDMVESNTGRIIEKLRVPIETVGSSTCTFCNDHVLYSKLRPYLNKVVVPDEEGYATSEMIPLKPNPTILNRTFLAHLLRSNEFVAYVTSLSTGTRMPRVPMTVIRNFKCILPPIEMQNRFTAIIKQVDKSKFELEQALAELNATYKKIISENLG
jgi:type I restriction enzyme, S subunit